MTLYLPPSTTDFSYNLSVDNYTGMDLTLETQMQKYVIPPNSSDNSHFSVMVPISNPVAGRVPDRVVLRAGNNSKVIYLSKLNYYGSHSSDSMTTDVESVPISVGYMDATGKKILVDPDQNPIEETETNTNYIYLINRQQRVNFVAGILSKIYSYLFPDNGYSFNILIIILLIIVAVIIAIYFAKRQN